jgi:metallo-beta-lactamase family protein
LVDWIKDRAPVKGSLFLVHGDPTALTSLAETLREIPGLPAAVVPALGETWALQPAEPATRQSAGRADAEKLTASRDWVSKLAALRTEVEEKISRQPTDQDREKMLAALRRALDSVN